MYKYVHIWYMKITPNIFPVLGVKKKISRGNFGDSVEQLQSNNLRMALLIQIVNCYFVL
jgi:hypothetical protein